MRRRGHFPDEQSALKILSAMDVGRDQVSCLMTGKSTFVVSAEGAWLYGVDGKRYLDAVSSWWTCLLGHRDPRIVAALKAQLDTLDHVMLAGFTHEPAIALAEALVDIAPKPADATRALRRVFYADNGSSAVEVALKLSFHFRRNRGEHARNRFVPDSAIESAWGVSFLPSKEVNLHVRGQSEARA